MDLHKHLRELRQQEEELKARIRKGELIREKKQAEEDLLYTPRIERSIGSKGDYAGFHCKGYSFYYGYEETADHPLFANIPEDKEDCKTSAFTVTNDKGEEIFRKAIYGEHVEWNHLAGLLAGIGYWLEDKAVNT
jgi:hypothetical protein